MDIRLNDAIEHYLMQVAPNRLKESTLHSAHGALRAWRKALGNRTRLRDITTSRILTVRDNYPNPATANRMISVLSALFQVALEREWVDINPCRRIRALKVRNENTGTLITPWEEEQLKGFACMHDQGLWIMLHLAFETGARVGELEKLTWDDVDLGGRTMTFPDTKNGTRRTVPISAENAALLAKFGLPGPLPRVLWRKAVVALGRHIRFHDIRHTMISRTLARGIPITTVARMVGHKTLAMTMRYHHADLTDLRAIVDAP